VNIFIFNCLLYDVTKNAKILATTITT